MIVSRRNMLAVAAAGGVLGAQLGNPDSPAQGPKAIKNKKSTR